MGKRIYIYFLNQVPAVNKRGRVRSGKRKCNMNMISEYLIIENKVSCVEGHDSSSAGMFMCVRGSDKSPFAALICLMLIKQKLCSNWGQL